jgi:ABC-type transport system involved in multi-copper enzyme maturation permease subunit
MVAMTALAGVIGWSSHQTISRVYDEASRYVAAQGHAAPPNPFLQKPALDLLANMEIYVPLIGALLALVVGHAVLADETTDGVGRLVFSRPVSRRSYVLGKLTAVVATLGLTVGLCGLLSVAEVSLVNGRLLTAVEVARVAGFFAVSWLYLLVFALVGMASVVLTGRRPLGLLVALGTWLLVTFTLPEFISGLHPVASLNPVSAPAGTSQQLFAVTSHVAPVSIFERYKEVSAQLLQLGPSPSVTVVSWLLPFLAAALGLVAVTAVAVTRHDFSRGAVDA